MPGRSYYTPFAQSGKYAILAARVTPDLAAVIEDAARSLDIPRHHVLRAALRLGVPLAISELIAKTQGAAGKDVRP